MAASVSLFLNMAKVFMVRMFCFPINCHTVNKQFLSLSMFVIQKKTNKKTLYLEYTLDCSLEAYLSISFPEQLSSS